MRVARCEMRDAGCGMRDAGCGMRDAGCGMRDAGCGMRDAGCGMRDAGCGMRDARCEMRDARCGMRDAGCGMQDAGCGMRDAGCGMRDARNSTKLGLHTEERRLYCSRLGLSGSGSRETFDSELSRVRLRTSLIGRGISRNPHLVSRHRALYPISARTTLPCTSVKRKSRP